MTTNEMLVSLNVGVLAIVPVGDGGFANEPIYVRKPFEGSPAPDSSATIFKLEKLLPRGTSPR